MTGGPTVNHAWVGYPSRVGDQRRTQLKFQHDDAAISGDVAVWHYPAPSEDSGLTRRRILMVHGFRGDHHGMQLVVDSLPDFEVVVPDLPGFGANEPLVDSSGHRVKHSVLAYAGFIGALAEALSFGPDDLLVGHSFGSLITAAHAATGARDWAGMVLAAPVTDPVFTGARLPGAAGVELYYRVSELLPESLADRLISSRLAVSMINLSMITSTDPEVVRYAKDQHRRYFSAYSDRATLLEAYEASSRYTVQDFAADLDLPVLLAPGAKDVLSTTRARQRIAATAPDARTEVIRGTGHLMHYEKPAQLARTIRRFSDALPPAAEV